MNKLIILLPALAFAGIFSSCKKGDGYVSHDKVTIALLKVDYKTHKFEGGKLFYITDNTPQQMTIPVKMTYISPGDFGNITLQNEPTGDTLFDGSIVWNGKGEMRYPALSSNFPTAGTAVPAPDSNDVQIISPNTYIKKAEYPIASIWSGISNLLITRECMKANVRVGLFLYTPSVGVGNPADWDYFWILYVNNNQLY